MLVTPGKGGIVEHDDGDIEDELFGLIGSVWLKK